MTSSHVTRLTSYMGVRWNFPAAEVDAEILVPYARKDKQLCTVHKICNKMQGIVKHEDKPIQISKGKKEKYTLQRYPEVKR